MADEFSELDGALEEGTPGGCGCNGGGTDTEPDPFGDLHPPNGDPGALEGGSLDSLEDLEGIGEDDLFLDAGDDFLDPLESGGDELDLGVDEFPDELADLEATDGAGSVSLEDVLALAKQHPGLRISFGF